MNLKYIFAIFLSFCSVDICNASKSESHKDEKSESHKGDKSESHKNENVPFENTPLYKEEYDNVYDPLEPYNRLMFKINGVLEKVYLRPITTAYKQLLPKFIQCGTENFVDNFFAPVRTINFVLQGDGKHITNTIFRFIINTAFGFFGTVDVATKMGIANKDTSLGETFKKWGAKPGPYVVLPLFGSTSFRGAMGKIMALPIDVAAQISLLNYKKNTRNRLYYVISGTYLMTEYAEIMSMLEDLEKTSSDMYVDTRNVVMSLEK